MTLTTALASPAATVFHAVKIVLPSATLRLLDGAGTLTIDGETYTGKDATYGQLAAVEQIREEIGVEAPRVRLTILPPSAAAIALFIAETTQMSPVTIWYGAMDRATGAVESGSTLVFTGFFDTAMASAGDNTWTVEVDVASDWDRFFVAEEGARLNSAFQRNIWPGDLGLDFLIDALSDPYWGKYGPNDPAATILQNFSGNGAIGNAVAGTI